MARLALKIGALALALYLHVSAAIADGLPPEVMRALKAAQIPADQVAVVVQPVDGTGPSIAHQAGKAMNPASVMKLLTTYAALDLLGPAWTWPTTLWLDAPPSEGVLAGNLYLRGSGDPRFTLEHLSDLLRQARTRGIRQISGDIVLDRSAFEIASIDPGAFDDKPMRPYNVGPNALLIDFQAIRFSLQSVDGKPRILMETPSDGLRVDNRLQTSDTPCGSNWKDFIQTRLLTDNGRFKLEFTGTYSSQCGEKSLNLAPLAADEHATGLIRALWLELGGTLSGTVRAGKLPGSARLFLRHDSPALADIVRDINKFSNNVMARQVFLSLGSDSLRDGELFGASAERARQRIEQWLAGRNLRFPELVLENGSGLSRRERISAGNMTRLLLDAWKNPVMPEFISSMPIVGVDGTMKKRLTNATASGRAHIKTGTLDGVKTAAGYALDAQGRRYALSFFINHPRSALGGPAIDALIAWVAERRANEKMPALVSE